MNTNIPITTINHDLDNATNGGLQRGFVTEICGEEGVGKTCLAMQLCLGTQIAVPKGCAVYIATRSPFPAGRMRQIAANLYGEDKVKAALENVHVHHSCDPNELSSLLTYVNNFMKSKMSTTTPVSLLVLDTLCDFYWKRYPNTREGNEEKNDLMRAVGYALKRMANTRNIGVVVCNSVMDSYDPNNKNNFKTGNRIVRPKLLNVLEKNIAGRWILARKFNSDNTISRTFAFPNDENPRCEYHITSSGIIT